MFKVSKASQTCEQHVVPFFRAQTNDHAGRSTSDAFSNPRTCIQYCLCGSACSRIPATSVENGPSPHLPHCQVTTASTGPSLTADVGARLEPTCSKGGDMLVNWACSSNPACCAKRCRCRGIILPSITGEHDDGKGSDVRVPVWREVRSGSCSRLPFEESRGHMSRLNIQHDQYPSLTLLSLIHI